jgi:hypothetical protein
MDHIIMPPDMVERWKRSISERTSKLYAMFEPEHKDVLPLMKILISLAYTQKVCYAQILATQPGRGVKRSDGKRLLEVEPETIYSKAMHRQVRQLRAKRPDITLESLLCGYYYYGTADFIAADEQVARVHAMLKHQGVVRKPGRPVSESRRIGIIIENGIKERLTHLHSETMRFVTMRKDLIAELAECGEDPQLLTAFCTKYNLR